MVTTFGSVIVSGVWPLHRCNRHVATWLMVPWVIQHQSHTLDIYLWRLDDYSTRDLVNINFNSFWSVYSNDFFLYRNWSNFSINNTSMKVSLSNAANSSCAWVVALLTKYTGLSNWSGATPNPYVGCICLEKYQLYWVIVLQDRCCCDFKLYWFKDFIMFWTLFKWVFLER